jgi:hypothetical protein
MLHAFLDALKNYGRNGTWFIAAALAVWVAGLFWEQGGLCVLVALTIVLVARVVAVARELRLPAGKAVKFPPLSQNEWETARSKLLKRRGGR